VKKYITVVLVLALVLVAAPWGIGRLARQRIDAGLDQIVKQAPYLTIAERKWSSGWFRSEQDVTFEVLGPWTRLMKDMVSKSAASATPAPAEMPVEPLRFTVHNEILHGPVLWPTSFGIARVNSKLVMSEAIRSELIKEFGTDEPVRISTRVGFFGGGTTTLSGDANTVKSGKDKGAFSYDAYKMDVSYSGTFDRVNVDGNWPRFEISPEAGGQIVVANMTLTSQNARIHGDLYDSDFRFGIEKVSVATPGQPTTEIENIRYDFDTTKNGDFVDFTAKLGSGKVRSPELADIKLDLNEVHYDVTMRRLHAATLEQLLAAVKASYEKPVTAMADVEAALTAPYKEYGIALLKFDPELDIDRIGIVTPEGEGVIKGVLRLKGVSEKDLEAGATGILGKIEADLTITVAQKLIEKIPNGATSAGMAIDQGYAKRDGDKIVSRIEFKGGELKINGKAQAIPGLGGPGAGTAEPPPQSKHPPETKHAPE
jgi:uncharacterized protein YdgA (DUF945 family)